MYKIRFFWRVRIFLKFRNQFLKILRIFGYKYQDFNKDVLLPVNVENWYTFFKKLVLNRYSPEYI